MDLGFNLKIDSCNTYNVVAVICVMVMVVVFFNCLKLYFKNRNTEETKEIKDEEDIKLLEQKRDDK